MSSTFSGGKGICAASDQKLECEQVNSRSICIPEKLRFQTGFRFRRTD